MKKREDSPIGLILIIAFWLLMVALLGYSCRRSWAELPAAKESYAAQKELWASGQQVYGSGVKEGKSKLRFPGFWMQEVKLVYEAEGESVTTLCLMDARDFKKLDGDKDGSVNLQVRYDRQDPTLAATEQTVELGKKTVLNERITFWSCGIVLVLQVLSMLYLILDQLKDRREERERKQRMERTRAQREQRERERREREQRERERRERERREREQREQEAREQERRQEPASPAADWNDALNAALREAEQRQGGEPSASADMEDTRYEVDVEDTVLDSAVLSQDSGGALPEDTILESHLSLSDNATILETIAEPDQAGSDADPAPEAAKEQVVPPDTLQKGSTLLQTYRIEAEPLSGAMGSVWRVHHLGWNMDMAMKRALPEVFQTEELKVLFIRECENWVNLGLHPNTVTCYYVRDVEGIPTAFSEWVDNGSLQDRIRDRSLYQGTEKEVQERLLDIAIQFARGLQHAHRQKLIHKDVKPANVLLTQDWEVKVGDFGLTGAVGGRTLAYCSPEQAAGRKPSRKTDLFSWAVSVLEMYLGRRPWKEGPVAGAACQDYFALSDPAAEIPSLLKPLLASCLEAETKNRPRDFAAVERELRAVYHTVIGRPYPRPAPKAVLDGADILNNRALSYLDLGKPEEAQALWLQATLKEPAHTETLFNRTLHAYRIGALTLYEAQSYLSSNWENHFNQAEPGLLLAELSLEGRDKVNAADVLQYVRHYSPMDSEQVRNKLSDLEYRMEWIQYAGMEYRCAYQISRIQTIAEREKLDSARDEALRGMKQLAKKGKWDEAATQLLLAHMGHELGDALYQPDWLAFYEQLSRRCRSGLVLAQWPIRTVSGVSELEQVSFSADSRLFLCGQRLYDLETGELLADNRGEGEAVRCSDLSPDGRFYLRLSAEDNTVVEQVEARTGTVLARMEGHLDEVHALAISRDGRRLATGDESGTLMLWDSSGVLERSVSFLEAAGETLTGIQFGYDRNQFLLNFYDSAGLWDGKGESLRSIPVSWYSFCDAAVELSYQIIALAEGLEGLSLFNPENGKKRAVKASGGPNQQMLKSVGQVAFLHDNHLLMASGKRVLYFVDPWTGKMSSKIHIAEPADCLAVSRNGKYIAYTSANKAHLWRLIYVQLSPDGKEEPNLLKPCAWIHSAAAPEQAPEALLDGLMDELADRGCGWVSREKALSALKQARADQST